MPKNMQNMSCFDGGSKETGRPEASGFDCRKSGCGHFFEEGLRGGPGSVRQRRTIRRSLREKCFSRGTGPREKQFDLFHGLRLRTLRGLFAGQNRTP